MCEAIEGTLLSSPSMTAKWETYLKKIGEGKGYSEAFITNINKFINNLIETAPEKLGSKKIEQAVAQEKERDILGLCPVCKKGNMLDRKTFIGCSEYKNGCKFSINKIFAKKNLTEKNIKDLLEKGKTSIIKGFISSKGNKFDAALKVDTENKKVDFIYSNQNKSHKPQYKAKKA